MPLTVLSPTTGSEITKSTPVVFQFSIPSEAALDSGTVQATDRTGVMHTIATVTNGTTLQPEQGYSFTRTPNGTAFDYEVKSLIGWADETLSIKMTGKSGITNYSASASYTIKGTPYTDYSPITDVVSDGLGLLLEQFKGKPNIEGILGSFLNRIQKLQDAAYPVIYSKGIEGASGDRLDWLGLLVGVQRAGRTDDAYRLRLSAEMLVLNSGGTLTEILKILQLLRALETQDFEVYEHNPSTLYLRVRDHVMSVADAEDVKDVLKRAAPAGVELLFVYSLVDDAATFRFATDGAASEFASAGFASVPPTSIGTWLYDNTSTTSAGLLSGGYRFNALSYADATELYVHDNDSTIVDKSADLAALLNDTLILETGNPAWIAMTVTSVTNNGSFYTLGVGVADTLGTMSLNQLTEFHAYINNGGRLAGVA